MPLPEWLQIDSLLPTLKEFQETSDAGTFHRRASSSITEVDKALTEFWTRWVKARTAPLTAPPPPDAAARAAGALWREATEKRLLAASAVDVASAKGGLEALVAACDEYIAKQTAVASDVLDRGMGLVGEERLFEISAGQVRSAIAGIPAAKRDRVAPTLGLRYLARVEHRRVADWVTGPPPQLNFLEAWGGTTAIPPLEIWKIESSGGADKSWTLRGRSQITKVDDALAKWWVAFKHLDRDAAAGTELDALVAATQAYLDHKAEHKTTARAMKMARVAAARRLLARAKKEKTRLAEWRLLVPPRVDAVTPLTDGETVDEFLATGDYMELRTNLPSLAVWKEQSSVLLAIRSTSQIVELVDRPLELFWKALVSKHRAHTLTRLSILASSAAQYLIYKEYKDDAFRVDAVRAIRQQAEEEHDRLEREWPENGIELPPLVNDNDFGEDPEVLQAAEADVSDLSQEIDPAALVPVTPADVARIMGKDVTGEPDLSSELTPLANVLNQRNTAPWFGRSRCIATVMHEPRQASREILGQYGREKKWVTRQIAAIQACSVVKYPLGVSDAAEKKFRGRPVELQAHLEKYNLLFERVVSIADWAARRIYNERNRISAWQILDELGWSDRAQPLVLPMMSIITLVFACKWKESTTSKVVLGVASFGEKRAFVTAASTAMTLVTSSESMAKIVEVAKGVHATNFIPSANIAAHGATGASVLGIAGGAIAVPLNCYQIYKSVEEHKQLTTMLERFAALQTKCPQLAELIDSSPFFMRLRTALMGKLGRRQFKAQVSGGAAAAAIAGTAVTTCVAIWASATIANAWNPVGWTLAGIGAVASIGLLIYKIRHRSTQEAKLLALRVKYNIPSFVKTQGEFERFMIADLMYRAALNDTSVGTELLAIGYGLLFLVFGGSIREYRHQAIQMGHAGIMAFIKG
jgi:hypothetical protein